MKTKLLKKLRAESRWHYGVFKNNDGLYEVVHDRDMMCPDLSKYGKDEWVSRDRFEVVETVGDLELAKKLCDDYRRGFILRMVRKMRYGRIDRLY